MTKPDKCRLFYFGFYLLPGVFAHHARLDLAKMYLKRKKPGVASDRDAPEGLGQKANRVGDGHRAGDDDQVREDAFIAVWPVPLL